MNSWPGDLDTGEGIDAAVAGTEVIVHCAGSQKGDGDKARTLVRAASRAGAPHLVNISVVGADRIPVTSQVDRAMFGYFGAKLDAEQVIAPLGLPWTTLRATQFYDLLLMVARPMARLPVIPVLVVSSSSRSTRGRWRPGSPSWPSAGRLAWCRTWPDRGCTRWPSCSAATCGRRGSACLLVPFWVPGQAAARSGPGANLAPDRAVGHRTWEDFLTERVGSS